MQIEQIAETRADLILAKRDEYGGKLTPSQLFEIRDVPFSIWLKLMDENRLIFEEKKPGTDFDRILSKFEEKLDTLDKTFEQRLEK